MASRRLPRYRARMSMVQPPSRLLLGPGPSMVNARVYAAMAKPQVGHLDPWFLELLEHVKERLVLAPAELLSREPDRALELHHRALAARPAAVRVHLDVALLGGRSRAWPVPAPDADLRERSPVLVGDLAELPKEPARVIA